MISDSTNSSSAMGSTGRSNTIPNGLHGYKDSAYTIRDTPLGYARHLRVICIGAGASGLDLAFHMRKYMRNFSLVLYEKNAAVGGTWLENKYPGCACDIPAHNYQFSWSLNPDWSEFYATAGEILQYIQSTAEKHHLESHIRLRHRVTEAAWDEEQGMWNLKILDELSGHMVEDKCDILVNGSGFLNNWKWPEIAGLGSFKGDLLHTANWQADTSLQGKSVGVIGNGSSGIQVLVAIHPEVRHLTTFIRSPTWVTTSFAQEFAGPHGANFRYTNAQKEEWAKDPAKFLAYRKAIEEDMSSRFEMNLKDSESQEQAKTYLTQQMKERLGDYQALADDLIPTFGVGCRRPTPGNGYLEALVKDNTRIVTKGIAEVLPQGIKLENGEIIELDSIVCATGFDYSWIPRFPIYGRKGTDLRTQWKQRPTGYLGLAVNDLPNYFVYAGPNSALSHGSALPTYEAITKYIIRMMWKAQTENYKSFVPSDKAVTDFVEHCDIFHKRTIWGTKCRSWFKGGTEDGAVLTHPGSRLHNMHSMINPRYEDWEWTSFSTNRFSFWGNGFTVFEIDEEKDKTWFVTDPDTGYETLIY